VAEPLTRRQRAQVLVFFAMALPLVLLPIAAYAVDAAVTVSADSRLVEVTAQAAEQAVEEIEIGRLRAGGGISIDVTGANEAAVAVIRSADPEARVADIAVLGSELRLVTTETIVLPFKMFGSPQRELQAAVTARITAGYDRPSSALPLPVRIF
jgi:hypothetical protein